MATKKVENEITISNGLWSNFENLRKQFDGDYEYVYEYADKPIFPEGESGWEEVRYNGASVIVNKCLALLADAWVQITIPMPNDNKLPARESISKTEKVAIGSLYAADRNIDTEFISKPLQDMKAWNCIMRGGTVSLVWLYENEQNEVIHDIREYDPYNCLFMRGRFEYRYQELTSYLQDKYGSSKIKGDYNEKGGYNEQRTTCREIWRPNEWMLLVGDKQVEGDKTNLQRIPVKVSTVGSVPLVHSGEYQDTLKHSFVSALTNNRDLYDEISRVLSILASRAKDSGRVKVIAPYDGLRSGGETNTEAEKAGYAKKGEEERNVVMHIDVGKGQGTPFILQPPTDQHLMTYLQVLFGMDILGSIDPIAFGQQRHSGSSGALAAELRNAALEFLNPFKKCMQESYIFDCEEVVKQFIKNEIPKTTFKGYDSKRGIFYQEIEPSEVTDKEPFSCNIVFDKLRDEAQEIGNAINKVKYGFSSVREALEKHHLSENPDKTIELMNQEKADNDPVNMWRNWAYAELDKDTPEGNQKAMYYFAMSEALKMAIINNQLNPLDILGFNNNTPYVHNNPTETPQTNQQKMAMDMSR